MIDLADFDIIFQRVSQIRIVGKFIVTVCVTEQNGNREEEGNTFGRSRRKGMKLLGVSRRKRTGDGRGGSITNSMWFTKPSKWKVQLNSFGGPAPFFLSYSSSNQKLIIRECTTSLWCHLFSILAHHPFLSNVSCCEVWCCGNQGRRPLRTMFFFET